MHKLTEHCIEQAVNSILGERYENHNQTNRRADNRSNTGQAHLELKKMKITGYYNEQGYQIETDNIGDCIIYRAGNHALDSQQDGTGTEFQLSLETIRQYCEQTTREIATEKNAEFIGVEYLDQNEI